MEWQEALVLEPFEGGRHVASLPDWHLRVYRLRVPALSAPYQFQVGGPVDVGGLHGGSCFFGLSDDLACAWGLFAVEDVYRVSRKARHLCQNLS